MPHKSEKIPISNEKLDRRVKLTKEQKKQVIELAPVLSQRKLADRFGVSRRLIQFILDPKKLEENMKRRAERGGSKFYYDRNAHNKSMQRHRSYKHKLFKDGMIGQGEG